MIKLIFKILHLPVFILDFVLIWFLMARVIKKVGRRGLKDYKLSKDEETMDYVIKITNFTDPIFWGLAGVFWYLIFKQTKHFILWLITLGL